MSNLGSYPTRGFSESQKFLVKDPATGTASLVLGSDLVEYIRPSLNSVQSETTTDAAANTDYSVGTVVQTTGESAVGDGGGGVFLVVAGGDGDIPMFNGNDLLILTGANAASGISYDNSASGLSAGNVQGALDEIESITEQKADITRSQRNLIANGSFRVNQQGSASKTETNPGWNYDTWYYTGTYLETFVEEADIFDGTFTLSWQSDATAEWALADTATGAIVGTWASVSNGGNFTLTSATGNHLWVRFAAGTDGLNALDLVQLEVGSVATDFERRGVSDDANKVIRYYEYLQRKNYSGYWQTSTEASVSIHFENKISTASLSANNTLIQSSGLADSVSFADTTAQGARLTATRAAAGRSLWDAAQVITQVTVDARPPIPV